MRAIIAGGRDFQGAPRHFDWLTWIHKNHLITEVVCGCAPGADNYGRFWAGHMGIPVKEFPADWNKHGRSAGPIRNRQMAEYVAEDRGLCILFPGGAGTASMASEARFRGLIQYTYKEGNQ